MISVVVLQNAMDLRKGERGSSSNTCVMSTRDENQVTGIEAERVSSVTEEEDQEPMTIPEIKLEPKVIGVPFGDILHVFIVILCCMLLMKQTYFQLSQHLLLDQSY